MLIENSGLILLYYHLRLPNYSYVQKNTKMNPLVPSQPNLSFLFKFDLEFKNLLVRIVFVCF